MRVKLSILSRGNGWTNRVEECAELQSDGTYTVITYRYDGDDFVLRMSDDGLEHVRTGAVRLRLSLRRGESALCEVGDGSSFGGYTVTCKTYSYMAKAKGVRAEASYTAADGETVRLKILAVAAG